MKRLLIFLLLIITLSVQGQTPTFEWIAGSNLDQVTGIEAAVQTNIRYKQDGKGLYYDCKKSDNRLAWGNGYYDFGTEDFTFVFAASVVDLSYYNWFFAQMSYPHGIQASYNYVTGRFTININDDSNNASNNSATIVEKNKIYHLVYSADRDGNARLYVNGVLESTVDITSVSGDLTAADAFDIGTYSTNNIDALNGKMYYFKIYDQILTQSKINDLYAEFIKSHPSGQKKEIFIPQKPTDLSSEIETHRGDEIITNGGFDTDSDWNMSGAQAANITISGGTLNFDITDGSFAYQNQAGDVLQGDLVEVSVTVSDLQSGALYVYPGNTSAGITVTSDGIYTFQSEWPSTDYNFYIQGVTGGATCSVDDVSVKRITGLEAAYVFKRQADNVLTDISGQGNNGTITGCSDKPNSLWFDGIDDLIDTPIKRVWEAGGDGSFSIRFKVFDLSGHVYILSTGNHQLENFTVYSDARIVGETNVNNEYYAITNDIAIIPNQWYNYTASCDGGVVTSYLNGDSIQTRTVTGHFDLKEIGGGLAYGEHGNVEIEEIRRYSTVLSQEDHQEWYNSYADNLTYYNTFKYEGVGNRPYRWIPGTGTYEIAEYSEISDTDPILNGDFSSWTGDNPDDWAVGAEDANNYITEVDDGARLVSDGTYIVMQQSTLTSGKQYAYSIILTEATGTIRIQTGADVHATFSTVGTHTGYFVATATDIRIARSSGACDVTISNFSVTQHNPLEIQNGDKYTGCTSSGTAYFQSDQAYGTWEFDVNKGTDGSLWSYYFISSSTDIYPNNNSYYFQLTSTEQVRFIVFTGAGFVDLFKTPTSYISINTNYRFKATRTHEGVWTWYIKGGSFGSEYILIDPSGGTGTNPATNNTHTISNYSLFDLDADSFVSRLIFKEGIIQ